MVRAARRTQPARRAEPARRPRFVTSADPFVRAGGAVVAAGLMVIPLLVAVPVARDAFRFAKELALRAEAIALIAVGLTAFIHGRRTALSRIGATPLALVTAIWIWSAVAAVLSTRPAVSGAAMLWISAATAVFAGTYLIAPYLRYTLLELAVWPAVLNAVFYWIQELGIANPFASAGFKGDRHLLSTALIGNPNDVGIYMVVPTLIAIVSALSRHGRSRLPFAAAAALLALTVFGSRTVTAIVALVAACVVLALLVSRRKGMAVTAGILIAAVAAVVISPPLRARAVQLRAAARAGDIDALLTYRLSAFLAATAMFRDHPLTGVGPGAFASNYASYRAAAEEHRPAMLRPVTIAQGETVNFGEVHNDHLQILAEGGLPAYALFVAGVVLLISVSFRRSDAAPEGSERRYARLIAAPLAVALVVSAAAQFPLELAAPLHVFLSAAAVALRWSRGQ